MYIYLASGLLYVSILFLYRQFYDMVPTAVPAALICFVLSQINGCNGSYTNTDDHDVARHHISGVPLPVLRRSPDVSERPHLYSQTRLRGLTSRVLTDVTEDPCGCKRIESMVFVRYMTVRIGSIRARGEVNFDYSMKIEECGTSLPLSFIGTTCRVRVRQCRTRCGCADVTFVCELKHKFWYSSLLPGVAVRYRVYTHQLASRQLIGVCQCPTEHVARSQISGNQGSWTNSDDVKSDSGGGGPVAVHQLRQNGSGTPGARKRV